MRSSIGGWLENSAISAAGPGADAHGLQRLRHLARVQPAQAGQRVDHRLLAAHQAGGAGVGAELALAREPGHDHRGDEAEQDVHHDGGDEVADADAVAVVLQDHAVDEVADDARDEDHEGVHHALDQRHRHHVAVGHVRHLVADDGLDLLARHALQQAGGHRHQRRVLERAGGEGVRRAFVDADLGHADAGLVGEAAHRLDQPGMGRVARVVDDLRAGAALGDRLAHQQRDDRAAEADRPARTPAARRRSARWRR